MQSKDISVWQVLGVGFGFVRNNIEQHCELAGFVSANDPDEAFSKACHIAMKDNQELLQATGAFPRAVINAEEIQELSEVEGIEVDKVEVYWSKQ